MPRSALYTAIEPYHTGRLAVSPLHTLYFEQCGNPEGIPILFLHGGPGAGYSSGHRRFFDPDFYRVILFDQRGCGRSTPFAEIKDNDTQSLVGDIEKLREALGIDRWMLFGGSWGSSLALAYATTHPERCMAIILRGIFLCRASEVDWFMNGIRNFFPDAWDRFTGHLPPDERGDALNAYYRRLCDPDPAVHRPAAIEWSTYEATCSTLRPSPDTVSALSDPSASLSLARLEAHYFVNRLFLEEGELLEKAGRLAGIPGEIIQGRYDVVCPPRSAYELAARWRDAALTFISDAGHSATEPGIARALIMATEKYKQHFGPVPRRAAAP